ncbi:MAG TPA: hypothetical protein VN282_16995 [Pyrinomonadaceae bacterium]|nr:hypothetical protein [Pyrinomonadaceae bacterium]
MKRRAVTIALYACLLVAASAASASAQTFDLSGGGPPTITGALGGSVSGSSSTTQDLVVTVNFGEVSPANGNNLVKVVVPVAIRSTDPYQVTVSVSGTFNSNAQAVQRSDIGFGVQNIRQMGNKSQDCNRSRHLFRSPFSNDPASNVTLDASGRAAYTSSLQNVSGATVILSGPKLTKGSITKHENDNGYIFDAIFTIKPQFYASGTFSATITFTISAGPNVPC